MKGGDASAKKKEKACKGGRCSYHRFYRVCRLNRRAYIAALRQVHISQNRIVWVDSLSIHMIPDIKRGVNHVFQTGHVLYDNRGCQTAFGVHYKS